MTLALLTTEFRVDGAQVLGVVGLNLFFLTVTVLHRRLGWHILVADLLGIAVYVGLSALLLLAAPVPFAPALVGVGGLWAATMLVLRRRADRATAAPPVVAVPPAPVDAASVDTAPAPVDTAPTPVDAAPVAADAPRRGLPAPAKLLIIFVGAILTVFFGQLLQGMVVTFPYSGVLTAIETRRDLTEFSRHFARNSIALVAFTAGYYWLRDSREAVALAAGWGAFAIAALALRLARPWSAAVRRPAGRPTYGDALRNRSCPGRRAGGSVQ
jgi:hypothetical protein